MIASDLKQGARYAVTLPDMRGTRSLTCYYHGACAGDPGDVGSGRHLFFIVGDAEEGGFNLNDSDVRLYVAEVCA